MLQKFFYVFTTLAIAATNCNNLISQEVAKAAITNKYGSPLPEEYPLGEVLHISGRNAICGNKPNSIRWLIEPKERADRAEILEGGKIVILGTGLKPATLKITQIVAKGDECDYASIEIKLGNPEPVPPEPVPVPIPPNPAPQPSELALLTKTLAIDQVGPVGLNVEGKKLADSYKNGSQQILNGTLKNSSEKEIVDYLKASNDKILGTNAASWFKFRLQLGKTLDKLQQEGKHSTKEQWAKNFADISVGLELAIKEVNK